MCETNIGTTPLEVDDAKTTGDTDNKDVVVDSSAEIKTAVDKIISEAQNERSKRAVSIDKSMTAKRVGDKENPGELILWVKNPGKSD